MSALESDSSEDLPVELSRQIVEACERFEAAWKAGQPAAPENFVSDFTPSTRNRILAELDRLAAELQAEEVASKVWLPVQLWEYKCLIRIIQCISMQQV